MKVEYAVQVYKWEVLEIAVEGTAEGNPFTEQKFYGIFAGKKENVLVNGFYDGNGIYRIRFMPSYEGKYSFVLNGSLFAAPYSGAFEVLPALDYNHGPVMVKGHHFEYADGTPYIPVGTTAYAFALQGAERIQETMESLDASHFNKMRFCILPKHYLYNFHEPSMYPYEGTPMDSSTLTEDNFQSYFFDSEKKKQENSFDYTRFNPAYFRNLEACIAALGKKGIEADLIIMHPYDRWGFACMSQEEDDLYWNYVISRFSAFRNVWWSLANEYDLMKEKTEADWDRLGTLLKKKDPWKHPRSIHNCKAFFDHSKAYLTHVSAQRIDLYKGAELTDEWIRQYDKPVVLDELGYEGTISDGWGNLTAEETVRRFWETGVRGGYPGHGETIPDENNLLWWSHGGRLRGESWKRLGLLKDVLSDVPGIEIECLPMEWDSVTAVPAVDHDADVKSMYLFYYSFMRPGYRDFHIDDETYFYVEVIDTWNMAREGRGFHKGKFRITLPARQYMAIRLRKATDEESEELKALEARVIEEEESAEAGSPEEVIDLFAAFEEEANQQPAEEPVKEETVAEEPAPAEEPVFIIPEIQEQEAPAPAEEPVAEPAVEPEPEEEQTGAVFDMLKEVEKGFEEEQQAPAPEPDVSPDFATAQIPSFNAPQPEPAQEELLDVGKSLFDAPNDDVTQDLTLDVPVWQYKHGNL